jgi:N-carbamoylputrescine amidase
LETYVTKKKNQRVITVGLIQMKAEASPRRNLARATSRIAEAAKRGAQIICVQELFCSRYFPQAESVKSFALAETIPGPTTVALSRLAREREVVVVASVFERRAAGVYHNTAVVIDADGTLLGKYRKMHIPDDPCYYEKFYFTPGDLGFPSFKTRYARIAALVCWDQWFPEAARLASLDGAQFLFYPTAIGWLSNEPRGVAESQLRGWKVVQRAHAVANGVFVAAVNRVGREGKLTFWGNSFVADPSGEVIAQARDREEILLASCELEKIEATRQNWPFLRDRRIDSYAGLLRRFNDEK